MTQALELKKTSQWQVPGDRYMGTHILSFEGTSPSRACYLCVSIILLWLRKPIVSKCLELTVVLHLVDKDMAAVSLANSCYL